MLSTAEVTDRQLREALLAAERALDEGDLLASVELSVEAYARLIGLRPDMIIAPRFGHSFSPPQLGQTAAPPGGGGLVMGGPRPWPSDHGVRFAVQEDEQPTLTFTK